jgi:hypothetical protein
MNAEKAANRKYQIALHSRFATSGQKPKAFCAEHNIPQHIFYYWIKRVRNKKQVAPPQETSSFVPVNVVSGTRKKVKEEMKTSISLTMEIVCPNGITLKFYSPVNFLDLRSLIK